MGVGGWGVGGWHPEVVVLHNHQAVASAQLVLAVEDGVANALVVDVGPLVRAGDDDGLVVAHAAVARCQLLNQLVARHHADVGEAPKANPWQFRLRGVERHATDACGVEEDARVLTLTQHFVQVGLKNLQPVGPHHARRQGRTLLLAYGWQLGAVANQHQSTVPSVVDVAHQVVEQTAASEGLAGLCISNHRGLVHDEERVAVQVVVQREARQVACGALSVDAPMNSVGRLFGIEREHLCGTARGRHEHQLLLQPHECPHDGSRQRGLSRASRAAQYHHGLVAFAGKTGEHVSSPCLFGRGHVSQCCFDAKGQFIGNHAAKVQLFLRKRAVFGIIS